MKPKVLSKLACRLIAYIVSSILSHGNMAWNDMLSSAWQGDAVPSVSDVDLDNMRRD